ncbi:ABC transporter ATP-binding protein [Liberiplasma polymorphum]|jgi:fluoroquinolone transport system ATP-binding protein|uniref:ABC transporter ATP-binding protein n=1 Tax=Liberiplasma polymorphum TaxID=3374570 RepID=UPI003770EF09
MKKKVFEVKDLRFKYSKSNVEAVKGISFDVLEGEIFGLLGPSGAGKSTTQKIMTKLFKNYEGQILYLGEDLKSYNNSYYEDLGVGFELPVHFSKLTGYENMKFFSQLYQKQHDIDELLKAVGLYEDKDRMVAEYSKGMKMRLNFVRALLNDPKVLFLDEVTNGLDPKNARIIKDLIREFKQKGGTVFLTTHLMNDVEELCDKVAFIRHGEIVEISTPRELKIKHGTREVRVEYYNNGQTKLEVFELDQIGENTSFLALLKNKTIETIHSGETTLDDIFIKVTGETVNE